MTKLEHNTFNCKIPTKTGNDQYVTHTNNSASLSLGRNCKFVMINWCACEISKTKNPHKMTKFISQPKLVKIVWAVPRSSSNFRNQNKKKEREKKRTEQWMIHLYMLLMYRRRILFQSHTKKNIVIRYAMCVIYEWAECLGADKRHLPIQRKGDRSTKPVSINTAVLCVRWVRWFIHLFVHISNWPYANKERKRAGLINCSLTQTHTCTYPYECIELYTLKQLSAIARHSLGISLPFFI